MGKEIIAIAEALSNERGIPRERIFEALELALATATKKKYTNEIDVRVDIDRKEGSYLTYRRWTVVPDDALENGATEITLSAAEYEHPGITVGEVVEEEIESVGFDRITIQTAKQVLSQKVKDAEREQIIAEQRENLGQVITAVVRKQTHDQMILSLGNNAEAIMHREQLIPHEAFGRGDHVRVLLEAIREDPSKGPQIICSRTSPDFIRGLFRIEVPEIGEDVIEIMDVARDPGSRAKISVRSKDHRIDPRGACIGMRGARVTAVSNELSGEKIDVVLWDENLAQYVTNAMEPASVSRIIINEDSHSIDVAVPDDNLALAIGRNGQNVRLASQLLGWTLRVTSETEMDHDQQAEAERVVQLFVNELGVDEEFAGALADAGFTRIEEIAYVPLSEFSAIDGLDEELAQQLQDNAREALGRIKERAAKEGISELVSIEGVSEDLARELVGRGIKSLEDLAECATDELEGVGGLDAERAGAVIMAARNATWFKDEQAK
ncbi:MAG: transcription termination factor NusA [Succinivibrionaceae bacterium]|nr:transcription termination factor NusA [Succinivibrionaceae bacterium]